MPDPVSLILFQATKWEMFLENLQRVLDLMEGKIIASNPITTVAPHAFIPVLGVVNIKKLSCSLTWISLWTVTVTSASIQQWQISQKTLGNLTSVSALCYWLCWLWINTNILLTFQLTTEIGLNSGKNQKTPKYKVCISLHFSLLIWLQPYPSTHIIFWAVVS